MENDPDGGRKIINHDREISTGVVKVHKDMKPVHIHKRAIPLQSFPHIYLEVVLESKVSKKHTSLTLKMEGERKNIDDDIPFIHTAINEERSAIAVDIHSKFHNKEAHYFPQFILEKILMSNPSILKFKKKKK